MFLGLIGEDELVEVKCLYSVLEAGLTFKEAARKKMICLEFAPDDNLQLKRNHKYYYQVGGQLNISNRKSCYFVVYVEDKQNLVVEKINKDEHLWENTMLAKLKEFYLENVLPETICRNIPKGLKCQDSIRIKRSREARDGEMFYYSEGIILNHRDALASRLVRSPHCNEFSTENSILRVFYSQS